jgi:Protein of unknown function (DUF2934)
MQQQLEKTTAIDETLWRKISEPQNREQIAVLAYEFWQARGCPDGTPAEDWFRAEREIGGLKRIDEKGVESRDSAKQSNDAKEADSSVLRFPVESELFQAAHSADSRRA